MAEIKNIKFKEDKGLIQTNKKQELSSNTYLMLINNIFNEIRIFAARSVFTYTDLAIRT